MKRNLTVAQDFNSRCVRAVYELLQGNYFSSPNPADQDLPSDGQTIIPATSTVTAEVKLSPLV